MVLTREIKSETLVEICKKTGFFTKKNGSREKDLCYLLVGQYEGFACPFVDRSTRMPESNPRYYQCKRNAHREARGYEEPTYMRRRA